MTSCILNDMIEAILYPFEADVIGECVVSTLDSADISDLEIMHQLIIS